MPKKYFAPLLLCAGLLGSVVPNGIAAAQEAPGRPPLPTLVIASPANGALIEGPLTVKFAFKDHGAPPAGDARDGVPPPPPGAGRDGEAPPPDGNGPGGSDHRGRGGPLVYLLIDTPLPEAGMTVYVDGAHLPFPSGENQVTTSLRPGRHRLQLLVVGPDNTVGNDLLTSPSVMVTAQP